MNAEFENRLAIIADLRQRGATVDLDEGTLKIRAPKGVLTALELDALKMCRERLQAALRYAEGYCAVCGRNFATRPRQTQPWSKDNPTFCETCYRLRVLPIYENLLKTAPQKRREEKEDARRAEKNADFIGSGIRSLWEQSDT